MTVFYLVRHGQSEGNLRNEFIGHGNARLTELGRAQAQKTGEYLSSAQFDYAYGSDLLRAFETGEIILKNRDIELIPDKMLREIHAGEWEGKTFSELGFVGVALLLAVPVGVLVSYLRSRAGGRTPEKLFTAVYAIAFIIAIVAWNCTFTRFAYLNFFFLGLCNVRLGADSGKRLRGRESV